jgi:hypothetical protein
MFGEPVWQDGETHNFIIKDRAGTQLGTAQLSIEAGAEHVDTDGWTIRREIAAIGQSETVQVEVTGEDYRPRFSQMVRSDREGQQSVEATFNGSRVNMSLTNTLGQTTYERVNVPSDIRDERTLLLVLRTLPLAARYSTRINSFLPITGIQEQLIVQVKKDEQVTVSAGTYDAWLVELRAPDRTITRVWIAKEAPHPIVKYVDGRSRATYELESFVAAQ